MGNQVRLGFGVDDKASKPIRDIHDAWKRLERDGAKGLGLGLGAAAGLATWNLASTAIHGVTNALGDSVQAALEDEKSVALLSASLKANVTAHIENTAAIEDTIKSRMRLGFADEEQRAGLARLLAGTHDVARAQELLRTAMDLSVFTGQDLVSSSEALVKVDGGRYRMLAGLIGSTKDITTSEEALAAVHRATAGAAEELANTQGGKLHASQIQIGESMEKLGNVILPVVVGGMQVVADVAGTVADALGGLGDIIGGIGDVVGGVASNFSHLDDAQTASAKAAAANNAAITELQMAFSEGKLSEEQYRAALDKLDDQYNALIQNTDGFTTGTMTAGDAASATATELDKMDVAASKASHAIDAASGSAYEGSDYFHQFTNDAQETGQALDNVTGRAIAAGQGLDVTAWALGSVGDAATESIPALNAEFAALDHVAFSALVAARNLGAMFGTTAKTNAKIRMFGESGQAGLGAGLTTGDPSGVYVPPELPDVPKPPKTPKGSSGQSQAEKDAKAAADALRNDLKQAYDVAKQAAVATAATIHQGTLKSIADAKDHAYAVAQTTYNLKLEALEAQKAALYEKRNADQTALSADQAARNMRDLQESAADAQQALADAMAGGDPQQIAQAQRALRNANEAVADAQAQAAIAAETSSADAAAAKIDAQEQAAKDELIAAQKAADALAAVQTTAENLRYEAEKKAYDRSYQLLVSHLDDNKNLHSKVNKEILAAYAAENKKYEKAGAGIAASLLAGLKGELKVTLPAVSVSGTAEEWTAAASGAAATGTGGASGGGAAAGGAPQQMTIKLDVSGAVAQALVLDSHSPQLTDLGRILLYSIIQAAREQQVAWPV